MLEVTTMNKTYEREMKTLLRMDDILNEARARDEAEQTIESAKKLLETKRMWSKQLDKVDAIAAATTEMQNAVF
jgi:flagellar biosynthesis regulator FlaF